MGAITWGYTIGNMNNAFSNCQCQLYWELHQLYFCQKCETVHTWIMPECLNTTGVYSFCVHPFCYWIQWVPSLGECKPIAHPRYTVSLVWKLLFPCNKWREHWEYFLKQWLSLGIVQFAFYLVCRWGRGQKLAYTLGNWYIFYYLHILGYCAYLAHLHGSACLKFKLCLQSRF